ncbi:MAG: multidrug efflux SMR transporter [Filomicrobium sp.]
MSAWLYLALAISFEVIGTLLLKLSEGFEKWQWGTLAILCYTACFLFLAPAMKSIPIGVVYAMWAGIGIVAATLIGFWMFEERLAAIQLVCITLILVGSVGLKLTTTA